MKKLILSIAAISALLVSCEKPEIATTDNTVSGEKMVTVTFTAGVETKTHLGSDHTSVIWQTNDEISVFANGTNYKFTLVSGNNKTTGTFKGTMSVDDAAADEFYALYPYNADATIDGNVITTAGTGKSINYNQYGSFPNKVVQSVAHASAGEPFEFKLICALLSVEIPSDLSDEHGKVKSFTVFANAGSTTESFTAGTNKITVSEPPTYTISGGVADITTANNGGMDAATYYLPVKPLKLTKGLRIKVTYVDDHVEYLFTGKEITLERAKGYRLKIKSQPSYVFDDFESYDVMETGATTVGLDNYISGNTKALKIVENPYKTTANSSDKVLADDMSTATWGTSGYVQPDFKAAKTNIRDKFPFAVRDKFTGLRCKMYIGGSDYYPHLRYNSGNSYGSKNPSKINGTSTKDLTEDQVARLYKHDDWNLLEWNLSACGFTKTSFADLEDFQLRPFTKYDDSSCDAAISDTNKKLVYIDDLEFLY